MAIVCAKNLNDLQRGIYLQDINGDDSHSTETIMEKNLLADVYDIAESKEFTRNHKSKIKNTVSSARVKNIKAELKYMSKFNVNVLPMSYYAEFLNDLLTVPNDSFTKSTNSKRGGYVSISCDCKIKVG